MQKDKRHPIIASLIYLFFHTHTHEIKISSRHSHSHVYVLIILLNYFIFIISTFLDLFFMQSKKQNGKMLSRTSFIFLIFLIVRSSNVTVSHAGSPIKTIVVLVMENRSFDHMIGWMKKLNPEINGVDGSEWNPLSTTDPKSQRFFFKDQAQFVDPDPGHSFQAIREQIFGSNDTSSDPPPMNGFAQQAFSMDPSLNMSHNVMNGFDPDMVAVYKTLVSEFAVFDR